MKIKNIIADTEALNRLTIDEILAKSNLRQIVYARTMLFAAIRTICPLTTEGKATNSRMIADLFRYPTPNVIAAKHRHDMLIEQDSSYRTKFNQIVESSKI